MLLHDSLDDAVADVSADLPALVAASRRQGLSLRRRRRALATVGTAAAVTALAVGGYALLPGHGSTAKDGGVASETVDPGPLSGQTAPITDDGVAAALGAAVDQVADGSFSRYQGDVQGAEADASILFRPATGSGPAGQVMVNLQPLSSVGEPPYACEPEFMTACAVRTLPSGDTLRTYDDDGDSEFGAASQRTVAEVLSPARHLRVIVFATNTNPWDHGVYRNATVLDTHQLTEIATQPWWSRTRLPVEYGEDHR